MTVLQICYDCAVAVPHPIAVYCNFDTISTLFSQYIYILFSVALRPQKKTKKNIIMTSLGRIIEASDHFSPPAPPPPAPWDALCLDGAYAGRMLIGACDPIL